MIGGILALAVVLTLVISVRESGRLRFAPVSGERSGKPVAKFAFRALPASTKIYIDGRRIESASSMVSVGSHEIVAVAPGYYGEVRHSIVKPNADSETVSFVLNATVLPDIDEEQRFLKLADSDHLTEKAIAEVKESTLATALRAKWLRENGRIAEVDALTQDVQTLLRFGDTRAAVASVRIESVRSGTLTMSQVTQSLVAASAAGDAMASLFLATAYRTAASVANGPPSDTKLEFQKYCRQLALATSQGWTDVAGEHWQRDRCAK